MKFFFVMLSLAVAFGVGVSVGSSKSTKSTNVTPQLATVMTYVEYKDSICKDIESGKNVCGLKK